MAEFSCQQVSLAIPAFWSYADSFSYLFSHFHVDLLTRACMRVRDASAPFPVLFSSSVCGLGVPAGKSNFVQPF